MKLVASLLCSLVFAQECPSARTGEFTGVALEGVDADLASIAALDGGVLGVVSGARFQVFRDFQEVFSYTASATTRVPSVHSVAGGFVATTGDGVLAYDFESNEARRVTEEQVRDAGGGDFGDFRFVAATSTELKLLSEDDDDDDVLIDEVPGIESLSVVNSTDVLLVSRGTSAYGSDQDGISWYHGAYDDGPSGNFSFTKHAVHANRGADDDDYFFLCTKAVAFDGDGDGDLDVFALCDIDMVFFFRNDGDFQFTDWFLIGVFVYVRDLAFADVDEDGLLDLVVVAEGQDATGIPSRVTWFQYVTNSTDGQNGHQIINNPHDFKFLRHDVDEDNLVSGAVAVAAADLDGDNHADVAVADPLVGTLVVFLNDCRRNLTYAPTERPTTSLEPTPAPTTHPPAAVAAKKKKSQRDVLPTWTIAVMVVLLVLVLLLGLLLLRQRRKEPKPIRDRQLQETLIDGGNDDDSDEHGSPVTSDDGSNDDDSDDRERSA
mmetsp:Transcript_30823/g.99401  ORF Transcript_30823/g.99401 Transcript_30823/m.99401 type:complete len:491 (-) Transcript_30823:318-1790(-)